MSPNPTHVAVIGGGIAGLAAAAEVRRRRPELRLTLFEARAALGGRVQSEIDSQTGESIELGAEFVHGRPAGLLATLREAGLTLVADDDSSPSDEEDERGDSPFSLLPRVLAPLLETGAKDTTVARYLARRSDLTPEQRRMLSGFVQGFYLAPPEFASAKAIARMEVTAAAMGGAAGKQVRAGYGALARWLGRAVLPEDLLLRTAVEEVRWKTGIEIRARTLAGERLRVSADAAVIALPHTALSGSRQAPRFVPPLPDKQAAARALRMGHATKVLLRFRRPLDLGSFLFAPGRAVRVFWTAAAPQTRWLVGWAGRPGAAALDQASDDAVLAGSLESLAKASGRTRRALASEVDDFRVARWSREPFIRGSYAWVPFGADGAMARLAQPVGGKLFFAGEATEPSQAGTVHGAYESGVRAARELLESLAAKASG